MKRFYKTAEVAAANGGFAVTLDGRTVRTPAREQLVVPTAALAEAVAAEWAAQGEEIDPRSMVMTGLANAAIDQIAPDPSVIGSDVAAYGESDLLCYRAAGPSSLVQAQISAWNPLLDWAEQRYDVSFVLATGVIHVAQPEATTERLAAAVHSCDPFLLAGLSTLVTMSGSLVIGLACLEEAFPVEQLWRAAELDELWQAGQWGEDALATERRGLREKDFAAAARFASLSRLVRN